MGNVSTKINLAALKNAAIIKSGKNNDVECIIIPIAHNHLFRSEKGAVYLDLQGFELKNKKEDSKDTHLVKQSLPKDVFNKMTDEEKKAMPILGNHVVWGDGSFVPEEKGATTFDDLSDLPF